MFNILFIFNISLCFLLVFKYPSGKTVPFKVNVLNTPKTRNTQITPSKQELSSSDDNSYSDKGILSEPEGHYTVYLGSVSDVSVSTESEDSMSLNQVTKSVTRISIAKN